MRSEQSDVSRDFWMPDHSCRVCYECDLQFTVFHRRHHCRICGRVFCAKCTSNSILVLPDDPKFLQKEGERIRVCNYCLKRRQKELAAADNDIQRVAPLLSSSPSSASFASSKFNDTGNNSTTTAALVAHSAGAYIHPTCETATTSQSISSNSRPDKHNMLTSNTESVVDIGDPSPNEFGYCMNMSDDVDSEYDACHSDSGTHHFQTYECYGPVMFEDIDQDQRSNEGYPAEENTNTKGIISEVRDETEFHASVDLGTITERSGHDNIYECDASSAIYGNESDTEYLDFENNGLLWLPPDPEDEEDERDPALFNDEDEEDATGEWGYLRSSNSFGNGEYRSRDRSSEEHKKAMKNVVDGHFRALVAQLLQIENLHMGKDDDREGWLEIITTLSWEAATLLKPDTSKGGRMDPGGYVKVKCIACGLRSDSMVVRGVVCKKNVAHRHMSSKIGNPRFLILEGALEYHRVSNTLSSVDTLLQQETDHLKMAVAKINARHPNVLLVEKSVSRFAQDCLLAKNISLVLNIKKSLLQRIARCTGAEIVPSIDHLSSQKLGHCDLFHAEKFFAEHGSAGLGEKKMIKTLMFFEGCPRPLGCTVVLKGANSDELKKVKHVVQFGVFAAYHLALETSFLADEGASLPELPLKSPMAVALPDKPSSLEGSISMFPGVTTPGSNKPQLTNHQRPNASSSTVMINNLGAVSVYPSQGVKSASHSSSTFMCQYGDITALAALGRDQQAGNVPVHSSTCPRSERSKMGYSKYPKHELLKDNNQILEEKRGTSEKDRHLTNDTQIDNSQSIERQPGSSNLCVSHQGNAQSDEFALPKEEFPAAPSDHQSILVSLSSRCVWKGTVCERAHLLRIKYYGSFDKPLGRFLRDQLFDQGHQCRSCEMPSEAHVHCYTHQQGSLTISVRYLSGLLRGERDGKIWMWHRCLRCPRINGFPPATRRVVMSDSAWGLSFGKFLELSFSNNAAASRVASCGHSLHRDCLRFYGFGKMVACFRYAPINLHSVYLPPHKLDFNYQHQEWVQKGADEVADKTEQLFTEILNKMLQIADERLDNGSSCGNMKNPEPSCNVIKLEEMLHKERMEFQEYLQKVVKKDVNKGLLTIGILEVNNLRRRLFLQSYVWDWRLILFARDKNNAHDGQFPMIADISDTLDARWTGRNGPDLVEATLSSSSTLVEATSAILVSENSDERSGDDVPRSLSFALPTSSCVDAEGCPSWIEVPFSNLYSSFNRNIGNVSELHPLHEYNPVYINLFRDLKCQNGARLLFPIGVNDIVIPVYDDELTSIISYVLASHDYHIQVSHEHERVGDGEHSSLSIPVNDSGIDQPLRSVDDISESLKRIGSTDSLLSMTTSRSSLFLDPPSYAKAMNVRVSFTVDGLVGKVRYTVTCYCANHFDKLRRICCPSEVDFIRSLSRCKKWGAQGGKSNAFFAKSLDDRLIIKQVTKTELESFIQFAPEYFKYLSESISTGSPTCLAKILGIYQITTKHLKGGKESRMDVLVMENLLFGRTVTRQYDLKGSLRSRYNSDANGNNKVLLDQNLIEAMPTSPIFVGNKAKRLLERAVWNDTAFLASIDVMDYSLLVGVDEEKHELVLGIIDFMRQYTWDKHLETWAKASGILGAPKNELPTVISPMQYKKRFRKAMSAYFLVVPDQWSSHTIVPNKSKSDLCEDNQQSASVQS